MQDFRKLKVWEISLDFSREVYEYTESFPKKEIYGITSQVRRASISVRANIAEESSRRTNKDFIGFLRIALGSLNETITYIYLSEKLRYLNPEESKILLEKSELIKVMLIKLIKSINNSTI